MDVTRAPAADFTRFRGADATGVAQDHPNLPNRWSKTDNVAWVADVPGQGWGSPIVVGDRVFVSSVVADEENTKPKGGLYLGEGVRDPEKGIHHWMVYCFDLKGGKELWRHEAHTGPPVVPRHPKSSYAAETPTTDGERLFVLFGDLGLYCYSLDGNLLWSKPIEPKKTNMDYGAAASRVVHEGQVFVVYDNKEDSWLAAFDAKTGEQRWISKRDETMSWATPFVWQNELRTEIVVPGQKNNRSYSLDGKELWSFDGDMSVLVIPSPFAAHGMCYISSGYVGDKHRPTFAIRPGANGKLAAKGEFKDNEFIKWYQPQASPYNTTQIVYGDYLYTVYDQGFMTCHNALTGEEVYGKRRFSPKGSFTSSPWAYNGKVFCLSEDGLTYVIKAGPEFEMLQTNPLDELCIATPSVVEGKLLVRTLTKVYCITQGETTAATDPKQESTADESACDQPPPHHSAVVQTQLGPVSGTPPHDDSVEVFKGIPFAAPPVGDLRWRAPQPAAKWSDVRVCDEFAADL
jgi:outer membrane protein assembly factor BamB